MDLREYISSSTRNFINFLCIKKDSTRAVKEAHINYKSFNGVAIGKKLSGQTLEISTFQVLTQ